MNKLNIISKDVCIYNEPQLIEISIGKQKTHTLYEGYVDLHQLIGWLIDNESTIRKDRLPTELTEQCFIAKKVAEFYESLDTENDELIDLMFEYRSSHCLRFGCRGTDFPEIYIGIIDNNYEVSLFSESDKWSYFFDIEEFYSRVKELGRELGM
ncbi:hypothetical protein MXF13_21630 [Leclercia adecarboxylata]|uniref:hypothetical protein n=1 Tax=Leclercia adecarboxylata TaxID=83655 RepID=UPI002DBBA11D|nr:hypothetical protein [Leclercia adecarboxylata]MEB5752467.1 hypothetical protein [Leclercia adecarboxylata]